MSNESKKLSGYIKTSNLYLSVFLSLAVGFLGGVLFSSYRFSAQSSFPASTPAPATSAQMPLNPEQAQTLSALEAAIVATPDNVEAWTQLGHFNFNTGRYIKAIEAYEKSLELDPSRPDVWTDLGVMHRRNGDPQKAIESFEHALSLNSRHEVALFNKGVVLNYDLGDAQGAIRSWEKLVQINPNAKTPNGQLVKNVLADLKQSNPS